VWNDTQVSDLVSHECCIAFSSILQLKFQKILIIKPLLNLIMTLITLVTNSSLSGRLQLHKSISFYVYFNHDPS
jgi:hypothetical protein